jgi:hypothetical protein
MKKYAGASNASLKAPADFVINSQSNIFNEEQSVTQFNNGNSSFR